MKQMEAIEKILPLVIDDNAVRAVFLKGSIARGDIDEYSDVDFYCLVKESMLDSFLNKRIDYMEQYRPLIFSEMVNFVGPQIAGVFNNGLHFDLYTVTYESLHSTDKIKVLYDPEKLLSDYLPENLTLNEEALVKYFDKISFAMLEFEAAYCRKDLIWASRLGSHISGDLSVILRYIFDLNNAQLGFKRLYKSLDKDIYDKLFNAMDLLGPSRVLQGVRLLGKIANASMEKLPEHISNKINKTFFSFMVNRINSLEG